MMTVSELYMNISKLIGLIGGILFLVFAITYVKLTIGDTGYKEIVVGRAIIPLRYYNSNIHKSSCTEDRIVFLLVRICS